MPAPGYGEGTYSLLSFWELRPVLAPVLAFVIGASVDGKWRKMAFSKVTVLVLICLGDLIFNVTGSLGAAITVEDKTKSWFYQITFPCLMSMAMFLIGFSVKWVLQPLNMIKTCYKGGKDGKYWKILWFYSKVNAYYILYAFLNLLPVLWIQISDVWWGATNWHAVLWPWVGFMIIVPGFHIIFFADVVGYVFRLFGNEKFEKVARWFSIPRGLGLDTVKWKGHLSEEYKELKGKDEDKLSEEVKKVLLHERKIKLYYFSKLVNIAANSAVNLIYGLLFWMFRNYYNLLWLTWWSRYYIVLMGLGVCIIIHGFLFGITLVIGALSGGIKEWRRKMMLPCLCDKTMYMTEPYKVLPEEQEEEQTSEDV